MDTKASSSVKILYNYLYKKFMDKLLRSKKQNSSIPSNEDNYEGQTFDNMEYSQPEDQYPNESSDGFESSGSMYGKFANLGAPVREMLMNMYQVLLLRKKECI